MCVSMNEDLAEFEFNQTEKQREEDYWGKLEGDTDFDLPQETPERCGAETPNGACAQKAGCSQTNGQIQHGQIQDGQIQDGQIQDGQIQDGQSQHGQIQHGQIQHGMEVIASCGNRIGKVDHLDGEDSIKLMKHDSLSEGQHHWIPTSWVERVDQHVHLNLNSQEAMNRWKNEEACEACST
jgi:hypothetical protein